MALGYETNANPDPPCTVVRILSEPVSYARFPRIPNMITQHNTDVSVSMVVTMLTSLMIFSNFKFEKKNSSNRLYLPADVMSKFIERRIHDNGSETYC